MDFSRAKCLSASRDKETFHLYLVGLFSARKTFGFFKKSLIPSFFCLSLLIQTSIAPAADISITDAGFEPKIVAIEAGESIHWTNNSSQVHSVAADNGLFDSGEIPPGGGFSMALGIPASHFYRSTLNPVFTAEVRVYLSKLSGPPDALASEHIPQMPTLSHGFEGMSPHPDYGFLISRTRIILGFIDSATVAQVNAAIQTAGVSIIGGLQDLGILIVGAEDTPDFSGLFAALASLRAEPFVDFAAMSPEMSEDRVALAAEQLVYDNPGHEWKWDPAAGPNGEPLGTGGNWGLEADRFPQAWNLMEAIQRKSHYSSIVTGIFENGFETTHKDLNITVPKLCGDISNFGNKCTKNDPLTHGTHVAGTIGAIFNNEEGQTKRSIGVSGANPVAQMVGINRIFDDFTPPDYVDYLEILNLAIDQIPNIRVINWSGGGPVPPPDKWWDKMHKLPVCGPEDWDDGIFFNPEHCTPDNEDNWLKEAARWGKAAVRIAEAASAKKIIIIEAAGNNSHGPAGYCVGPEVGKLNCADENFQIIRAKASHPFAWASEFLDQNSKPNPIIIVEALDKNLARANFSNIGGHVSAPGTDIVSTTIHDFYDVSSGTSMAAPQVAGLAGYLLAYDESFSAEQLKSQILAWNRPDATDGAQPRIDAFASLSSLPGAIKDLVDVNDMSRDGNRRVELNAGGPNGFGAAGAVDDKFSTDNASLSKPKYFTHPDGFVDMRDFRRFRDALLQACREGAGSGECSFIPFPEFVSLNGAPDHIKKDLNLDGCVNQGANDAECPTGENIYPRFDFNGDGKLSLGGQIAVPLRADGTLAADKSEAVAMTDLDVLQSHWEASEDLTEGWSAAKLDELILSGDMEIHVDGFFSLGANEVFIEVKRLDNNQLLPVRTINTNNYWIVYTAPAGVTLEVAAWATIDGKERQSAPKQVTLKAGEDKRLDFCIDDLKLTASLPYLHNNGTATTDIAIEVQSCSSEDLQGQTVTLAFDPSGPDHGSLADSFVILDANNSGTTTFQAGTVAANYLIAASMDLGGGRTMEGTLNVGVTEPSDEIKIAYIWREEILSFSEEGSSRWNPVDPNNPNQDMLCGNARINGVVYDPATPTHEPLEGVEVRIVGANTYTATTTEGTYSIGGVKPGPINSPVQAIVRASNAEFTLEKEVTVFCDAFMTVEFGRPPPQLPASISGTVVDQVTGSPMAGVFIGSEFGAFTTTDSLGNYMLENVPLGAGDASRSWNITARPLSYPPERKAVVVAEGVESTLNFQVSMGGCDSTVIEKMSVPPDLVWSVSTKPVEDGPLPYLKMRHDGNFAASMGLEPLPGTDAGFVQLAFLSKSFIEDVFGWESCVNSFKFEALPLNSGGFQPDGLTLERTGRLTPLVDLVMLDEFVTKSLVTGTFQWETSSSLNPPIGAFDDKYVGTFSMNIPDNELKRYQDYALPFSTTVEEVPEGLLLKGLNAVAELEYPYESLWDFQTINFGGQDWGPYSLKYVGVGDVANGRGAMMAAMHQPELMFVPRGDGSALKFSNDVSQPILFKSDGQGGYEKYEYCQVLNRQYTTPPEYFSNFDLVQKEIGTQGLWKRNTTYDGISFSDAIGSYFHEYPMPMGPGAAKIRYSFVAIPYTDEASLTADAAAGLFAPPSCEESQILEALFEAAPNPAAEGAAVSFADQSSSPGNSIVSRQWDFGDGNTSSDYAPVHAYADNGSYTVQLTVENTVGLFSSHSVQVEVENAPPLVQISCPPGIESETVVIEITLSDPGSDDELALDYILESTNPNFNSTSGSGPAGVHQVSISGLPAGSYPLTVTATDKDGGVGTGNAELIITTSHSGSIPTSDPGKLAGVFDSEEFAFIQLLNRYRRENGLPPVVPSATLTKAARVQSSDMLDNEYFSHTGADGSSPTDRALRNGYGLARVGENLAFGLARAEMVLAAWKVSPSHNKNMLDSAWKTIGVSRIAGDAWLWAVSFGAAEEHADAELDGALALATPVQNSFAPLVSPDAMVLASGSGQGPVNVFTVQGEKKIYPPIPAIKISKVNPEEDETVIFTNASRDETGADLSAAIDPGDGSIFGIMGIGDDYLNSYIMQGSYDVEVTATDNKGETLSLIRTIQVKEKIPNVPPPLPNADFNLLISPASQIIVPGNTSNFTVSLASIDNFSEPVSLAVGALPFGVAAQFFPEIVAPSGMATLKITAAIDAAVGSFDLNVTGVGGGITHSTTSSVTVNFGLIPVCQGAIQGVVSDADTGESLPFASVSTGNRQTIADAEGKYFIDNLGLNLDNQPKVYTMKGTFDGYWYGQSTGAAACGEITTVDLELVVNRPGTISGFVYDSATLKPLDGAKVGLTSNTYFYTNPSGGYASGPLWLGYNNAPLTRWPKVEADGYWAYSDTPYTIESGKNTIANFLLLKKCRASVSGVLTYSDTGLPAANIALQAKNLSVYYNAMTNESGEFVFSEMFLGYNNQGIEYKITGPLQTGYKALEQLVPVNQCSANIIQNLVYEPYIENKASLAGTVTDVETSAPISGATIVFQGSSSNHSAYNLTSTDGAGDYSFPEIVVGLDDATVMGGAVSANHSDFWPSSKTATLTAGQNATADLALLKKRYGYIAGVVIDSATLEPIQGASFTNITSWQSLEDGSYTSEPLQLLPGNAPANYWFKTMAAGYWDKSTYNVTVEADSTTQVDVELLPVCEGATVVGSVVNAATGEPIEGATVQSSKIPVQATTTDQDGNFILENLIVGTNNSPIQTYIAASKSGFFPQSKEITIFCGASIAVEFGQPSTDFGTIEGAVMNVDDGQPMEGVFIGTEFGAATYTDADGLYFFTDVPLGANGADRQWKITAMPDGFAAKTRTATASASQTAVLDFEFGASLNAPPTVDAGGPYEADEGSVIVLDGSGSFDPDGDSLSYAWQFGIDSFFDVTHEISMDDDFSGEAILTVDDGVNDSVSSLAPVIFHNVAPTVDAGPNAAVALGDAFLGQGSFADPGADQWTATVDYQDGSGVMPLAINPDKTFDLQHVYAAASTYSVEVCVDDDDGGQGCDQLTVAVKAPNQPPQLSPVNNAVMAEGETLSIAITAIDPDAGPLTLTAQNLPPFAAFADNGGGSAALDLAPDFDHAGYYPGIEIIAFDGQLSDNAVFSITVSNVNRAPIADAGGPTYYVNEGDEFALSGWGSFDPDGDPITYSWDLNNDGIFDDAVGGGPVHVFMDSGAYSISLRVSDGSLNADDSASVTVWDRAPTAAFSWSPLQPKEGDAIVFTDLSQSSPDALASWSWDFASLGSSAEQNPTFIFDENGLFAVALVVMDEDGSPGSSTQNLLIANVAPTVNAGPDLNSNPGESVQISQATYFDPGLRDVHAATINWGDRTLPERGTVIPGQSGSGAVSGSHVYASAGTYTVEICVSDDDRGTGCDSLQVVVETPNQAPVFAAIGAQSVNEGASQSISLSATDADAGDVLSFGVAGLPSFCSLTDNGDRTGAIDCSPGFTDSGSYSLTARVADNGAPNLSDSETFTLTVNEVNRAPILDPIGNQSAWEGVQLILDLSAWDPDGDGLTFAMGNPPTGAELIDNGDGAAQFLWTPDFRQEGNYLVRFIVNDNGSPMGSYSEEIAITVNDVNRPPVLGPIGPLMANEGEAVIINLSSNDPDFGDVLTFQAANLPPGADFMDNGDSTAQFIWTPGFSDSGNYSILFIVEDDGIPPERDSEEVSITVGNVNRPPILDPVGSRTGLEGTPLNIALTARDPDQGDALTFDAIDLPLGAQLTDYNNGSANFSWTPGFDQSGNYQLTFIAVDNGQPPESDAEQVTITVGNVNRPPVLDSIGDRSLIQGETLTVTLHASDPDGDQLTFSTDGLPLNAIFTDWGDGSAMVDWMPEPDQIGIFNVAFNVSDGGDPEENDSEIITIEVLANCSDEICDGKDNDCDGLVDEDFDSDGDGYTACGGDCDDSDSAANPEEVEICDGVDNNCNGFIDEGCGQCDDFEVLGSVSPALGELWPPNHKMVQVNIDASGLSSNAADAVYAISSVEVVEYDQKAFKKGLLKNIYKANNFEPDVEITGPLTVNLRSERDGNSLGRKYLINVSASMPGCDGAVMFIAEVLVPHDQK